MNRNFNPTILLSQPGNLLAVVVVVVIIVLGAAP